MKNSKLEKVVNELKAQEISGIKKFLRSPFFNQREDVIELFDLITAKKANLDAKRVFNSLYAGQPFDPVQFRLVMSYLFRLIEKYLAVEELLESEETQKIFIARAYRKRNLPKQVQSTIKSGLKKLQVQKQRNSDWYNYAFQMQFERFQLESTDFPTEELNRQELSDTLDIAYLIAKLRQVCLLLSHQSIYKSEFNIGFLKPLFNFLEDHPYLEIPAIAVYYHCYFMLNEPDEEQHFKSFKELILIKGGMFSAREIRDLYLQAINYCIRKINNGASSYFGEAMDFYKEGLQKKYLMEHGMLSRFTYHNIVAAAIKTKDLQWVNRFIYDYKKNLERKYREGTFNFSLAKLEYSRKNYDAVLSLLQKSNFRDLLLNLGAKTLLLKIYYELEELDVLEAHLEAMKNFIRRKKIIGYHQKNYHNIIHFTRKLLSINSFDKLVISTLEKTIREADPLTEKDWLIAQTRKLSN